MSLAWPNHVHHAAAHIWFRQRGGWPWATTPVTEAGFVRVSSNAAAIHDAVTPAEAITLLRRLRDLSGHTFLVDDVPLVVDDHAGTEQIATHRQVTDLHLLALARRHGARLATFDRALSAMSVTDVLLVPHRTTTAPPYHGRCRSS